ncbi:MAG: nuclear transport factor 2 family protein [Pseudomonadota bacterium]
MSIKPSQPGSYNTGSPLAQSPAYRSNLTSDNSSPTAVTGGERLPAKPTSRRRHLLTGAAVIAVFGFMLAACTSTKTTTYVSGYTSAINQTDNAGLIDAGAMSESELRDLTQSFRATFEDIKRNDLTQQLQQVYAQEIYFNDTFTTIHSRDELITYLAPVADRMDYSEVSILDISASNENVYMRWKMDIGFTVLGKEINSSSIGMSQLQFNRDGEVVLHQDFWDNTEGFFRHLPVLGAVITKTRSQL